MPSTANPLQPVSRKPLSRERNSAWVQCCPSPNQTETGALVGAGGRGHRDPSIRRIVTKRRGPRVRGGMQS